MANVYPPTKFEANIFISNRDMAKNPKSKMAGAAILNFGKSGIFGHSNPGMANLYQCTKFEANIFINDRDIAENPK